MAFSKKPPLGEVGDVDRIVLYFGHHGVDPTAVQKMVEMKIGSKRCDAKRQAVIKDLAKEWFDLQDPKWMWDDVNIGIYIAWGLSKEEDLDRVIELTEAEIDALKPAIDLNANHEAMKENTVRTAAFAAIMGNRAEEILAGLRRKKRID